MVGRKRTRQCPIQEIQLPHYDDQRLENPRESVVSNEVSWKRSQSIIITIVTTTTETTTTATINGSTNSTGAIDTPACRRS